MSKAIKVTKAEVEAAYQSWKKIHDSLQSGDATKDDARKAQKAAHEFAIRAVYAGVSMQEFVPDLEELNQMVSDAEQWVNRPDRYKDYE